MTMTNDVKSTSVEAAIADAKAAFMAGKLCDYATMNASGAALPTSTVLTSWGPAMRR